MLLAGESDHCSEEYMWAAVIRSQYRIGDGQGDGDLYIFDSVTR